METYKDVLLSQAPAMYEKTGQSTGILMENYKGILLCARPRNLPYGPSAQLRGEAGGAGGLLTIGGETAPAFVPSGTAESPTGLGPSVEDRAIMERNHRRRLENYKVQRANACTVLTRHKRWLRSFASQVRKMKDDEIQREIELARRAEQLRQQQAQKRAEAPAALSTPTNVLRAQQQEPPHKQQQEEQQQKHQQKERVTFATEQTDAEKKKTTHKKKKRKPKWALTEDQALEDELGDADELLDFAKNLDYEKFISDYEVAGALAIMRERVEEIARENNWSKEAVERAASESVDDDDEDNVDNNEGAHADGAESGEGQTGMRLSGPHGDSIVPKHGVSTAAARQAAPRHAVQHTDGWNKSTSVGGVLKRAIFRDTLLLAERILASSISMQKIHTKYSLARLLQKCVLNGTDVKEAMLKPSIGGGRGLDEEPRVVKVHPEATGLETGGDNADTGSQRVLLSLQRSKERTQGLPYLYRCPAI